MIAFQRAKKESPASRMPVALQRKITSVTPSVTSEIVAGCTQIRARFGAGVSIEIEKEHPEYLRKPTANKP